VFTERTPRVAAARHLTQRSGRDRAGRFLAEGAQAVREALRFGVVHEIFATAAAAERHPDLGPATVITERAAAGLSETVTPQGIVAVCDLVDVPVPVAVGSGARLVAVLVGVSDPGNAGTVVRVADAAGAGAVVFAGDTVDPHNGKCVRASTGSLFHLPIARCREVSDVLRACRSAGLRLVGADGHAAADLGTAPLAEPTAWFFGSEAHGLPDLPLDHRVRVPIYGRAESLNLATAAALCLYASATAHLT
jgi:TrmH family RNA methyltransferase